VPLAGCATARAGGGNIAKWCNPEFEALVGKAVTLTDQVELIVPTFIGVTLLGFLLIHSIHGDPVEVRVGERGISAERLAYFQHELGLDQPLWKQFLDYEGQLLHGNLGRSVVTQESVWTEFKTFFPAALELGVMAAVRRGSALDYGLIGLSVTGASMPIFWWGLMAALIFSVALGWTPVSGRIDDLSYVEQHFGSLLIAVLVTLVNLGIDVLYGVLNPRLRH